MSNCSFSECYRFINTLDSISKDKSLYLSVSGEMESTEGAKFPGYTTVSKKDSRFKTKQIADVAEKCARYLQSQEDFPLEDRVELMSKLDGALKGYADRVEASIKSRWWYKILHFFNYQAKKPKNVVAVELAVKGALEGMKGKIEEQKAPKKEEPREVKKVEEAKASTIGLECLDTKKTDPQIAEFESKYDEYSGLLTKIEMSEDKEELYRLRKESSSLLKMATDAAALRTEEGADISWKLYTLEKDISSAIQKRIEQLNSSGTMEQKKALYDEGQKIAQFRQKLDQMQDACHQKLAEAKARLSRENQRDPSYLSYVELAARMARDVCLLIDEAGLRKSRFYIPHGPDADLPAAHLLAADIRSAINDANALAEECFEEAGLNEKPSAFTSSGEGEEFQAVIEKLNYDVHVLMQKSEGNAPLTECAERIAKALLDRKPEVIFGLHQFPKSAQEFRAVVRKLLVTIHPDKHPHHAQASGSIFVIVDSARKWVMENKYGNVES